MSQHFEEQLSAFMDGGLDCRRGADVIPTVGIIAVTLNRFGRDR